MNEIGRWGRGHSSPFFFFLKCIFDSRQVLFIVVQIFYFTMYAHVGVSGAEAAVPTRRTRPCALLRVGVWAGVGSHMQGSTPSMTGLVLPYLHIQSVRIIPCRVVSISSLLLLLSPYGHVGGLGQDASFFGKPRVYGGWVFPMFFNKGIPSLQTWSGVWV